MILSPLPDGWLAVSQSAHAQLAFQLADHWGNRTTPRPAPRPDVLAAVLLHDAGWDGREDPPRLAADGLPEAFDTVPAEDRRAIWSDSVDRAAIRGRYVAYLVSLHVSHLAASSSSAAFTDLLAAEAERRRVLAAELRADPRYRAALSAASAVVNRDVVRLSDALSVHLLSGAGGRRLLPELPQRGGASDLEVRYVRERTYRLRPWPLAGRRLTVHAEGRRLLARTFADPESLQRHWSAAETVRLSWTLLAPGEPTR